MEFRPCIDIHNGQVKQIVGGSLNDQGDLAEENFASLQDAAYFADFYRGKGLKGGHVILLNSADSPYYAETKKQAIGALKAYPGGLQAGGGITAFNAEEFLDAGASHVIVTSYVFSGGEIRYENLERLKREAGKEHIVIDLSCRKKNGQYYIVTDRWQKDTGQALTAEILRDFSEYCDEFLVHAVDVEGKSKGIEEGVVEILGTWEESPVTYAGGVHTFGDLEKLKALGKNRVNVTVGSALDLFGGTMKLEDVAAFCRQK